MSIAENVRGVEERMSWAAASAGRRIEDVRLIAITKTVNIEHVREAVAAGVKVLGENYVQEARDKIQVIGHSVEWHMTGHLQKNKAREAANLFDMVQAIDSLELAQELDKRAGNAAKVMSGLIEINIAGEGSKSGIREDKLMTLLNGVKDLNNLSIKGLMAIPPYFENPEEARPYFRKLRELRDKACDSGFQVKELSMGMSHDFEIAIEEGATMVRVGTAIFGKRR